MFETWAWTEEAHKRRKDQILLQQTPKGVQICSLMPESHWAKVRPLARVRNHGPQKGLIVIGCRDFGL